MQENTPIIPRGSISKKEVCILYNISENTLRELLNYRYYDKLKEVGYYRRQKLLTPKQFKLFTDIYGTP